MSVLIVTGNDYEHRYVANAICAAHDVSGILVCTPSPGRRPLTILRRSPLRFIDKMARRLFLAGIGDARTRQADLRRVLGARSGAFAHPDLVEEVGRPKDARLLERASAIKPDVIAVYGTGIVPDTVLACAKTVALNMHTGLSPEYRGVSCTIWPLIDGRPELIGATVHECVAEVDGGRVFHRQQAALSKDDGLHAVFARAVIAGTQGYVDTISRALDGTLVGDLQDLSIGSEYGGHLIGIRSELAARLALGRLSRNREG